MHSFLRGTAGKSDKPSSEGGAGGGGSLSSRRASYTALAVPRLTPRQAVIPSTDIRIDASAVLGSGRLGSVFPGFWLEQPVAIKRILPSSEETHNPGTKKRLEAEIAALLPHMSQPNILPLYGVCEQPDGSLWLVLKRGKRGSLKSVLRAHRGAGGSPPLPLHELFHLAKGIVAACIYLHGHGIVYQDLRPGNVLVSGDGNAMLDPEFGVIRQVLQIITSQERLTAAKTASGTWVADSAYAAPECFTGSDDAGLLGSPSPSAPLIMGPAASHAGDVGGAGLSPSASAASAASSSSGPAPGTPEYAVLASRDVFSFGMVLFEMVTGTPPFPAMRDMQIFAALAAGRRPDIPATVPASLAKLIRACWQHDPAARPLPRDVLHALVAAQAEIGHHHGAGGGAGAGAGAGVGAGAGTPATVSEAHAEAPTLKSRPSLFDVFAGGSRGSDGGGEKR
jgi:serine/threonine protein kinase